MASHLMLSIPPSQDTLFIRGFSIRRKVEDIKDFFERESGEKCTIVFHRDDEVGEQLFVALKFETKEAARDILDRFDNQEVFKDILIITWFRDMRKARAAGIAGPPKRYSGGGGGGRGPGGYDGGPHLKRRPPGPPTRYYPNQHRRKRGSSSRSRSGSSDGRDSRSRSRSSESRYRSESRSPSPRRSRDKSGDDYTSESSPERSSKDKKKKKKSSKSKKHKKRSRSVHSTHSRNEEDEEGNDFDDADDFDDPTAAENGGEKQLRSSVQMIEKKAASTANGNTSSSKSSTKEKSQQNTPSIQGQGHIPPHAVNAMAMQEYGAEGTLGASTTASSNAQMKDVRKVSSDQFAPMDEDLRSVKRVIKRTTGASHQHDAGESVTVKSRSRGGEVFADDPAASGVKHGRHATDEFDVDSAVKRRRIYNDDLHEGGDRRRDSGWGGHQGNSDWDNVTTFDFLMEQGVGSSQQSKASLIRDKKIEIERSFVEVCETLTSVIKLLVSKDPDLESRLQYSLRENVKEIGQRSIQELREFVDRINNDDLPAFR